MEKIDFSDLKKQIDERKHIVEQRIISEREDTKRIRTRIRNIDEQMILDRICVEKWKKAEIEGKIRYLADRKWYYDYR